MIFCRAKFRDSGLTPRDTVFMLFRHIGHLSKKHQEKNKNKNKIKKVFCGLHF